MPRHEYRDLSARELLSTAGGGAGEQLAMPRADRPGPRGGPGNDAALGRQAGSGDSASGRARAWTVVWTGSSGVDGPAGRPLVVLILVLALAAPFVIAVSLLWVQTGTGLGDTNGERQGITYLRPLVRLLAAASDQQSLDVAGTPGNGGALAAAIQDVDKVDAELGETVGAHNRWLDVRQRLTALIENPPAASSAYQSFGQVIDMVVALVEVVGDRATLILDPDLDSYYLMDVTLIRLPAILVSSGRLIDRASTTSATRAAEVAVFADQIRQQSAILDGSMRKSFAATGTSAVRGNLVSALDKFGEAVTNLAPPAAGFGGITDDAGRRIVARGRVRDAGLVLHEAALIQLDALLRTRADGFAGQRGLAAGAVTVALAGLVGWLLLWRRPVRREVEGGRPRLRPFGPESGMNRTGPSQAATGGAGIPAGAGPASRGQR